MTWLHLDDRTAPLVATICRRLDGIPLALELAAARLSSMSLRHLSERLDQRFRLLTGGSRKAMPRQQTLLATVDWSFDLLASAEREAMRRLSVFAGGFELEAAEAICAADGIDAIDVLDLLGSLVDKSLVIATDARQRGLAALPAAGDGPAVRRAGAVQGGRRSRADRHQGPARRLLPARGARPGPALTGRRQGHWLRRLDAEWDNIRAAFGHLAAEGRTGEVIRLGTALQRFAVSRAQPEVLSYLRAALEPDDSAVSALAASALLAASRLLALLRQADPSARAEAKDFAERSAGDGRDPRRAVPAGACARPAQ